MEQYQEQPAHTQKIAYQQRLLQEDLVTIRAQISRLSTVHMQYIQTHKVFYMYVADCVTYLRLYVMQEMALAWEEYSRLERSVEQLRMALHAHMNHSATPQVRLASKMRDSGYSVKAWTFSHRLSFLYLHSYSIFYTIRNLAYPVYKF